MSTMGLVEIAAGVGRGEAFFETGRLRGADAYLKQPGGGALLADLLVGATDGLASAVTRRGSPPAASYRPMIRVEGPAEIVPGASAGITVEAASSEAIAGVVIGVEGTAGYLELDLSHVATRDVPASFRVYLADALEPRALRLTVAGVSYLGEVGAAISLPVRVVERPDAERPPQVAGRWRVSGSYGIYMFEGCSFSDVTLDLVQSGGSVAGVVHARPAQAGRRLHGSRDVSIPEARVRSGMVDADGLVSFEWQTGECREPDLRFTGVVGSTAITGTVTRGAASGGFHAVRA
jgi:hypothetical protein